MDATDPENGETAAGEWQPEDSFTSSSPFPAEQNGSESASSKDEEGYDPLSECQDSQSASSSPISQTHFSPASKETLHKTSQVNVKQNAVNEDGELSDYSEDEDSEDEDVGEDEIEEEIESVNIKEEPEESVSAEASLPEDEESKKSSFSLYSGVSDIISGSCSSPSSNSSTPSHSSNKAATTPSPGLQNLSGLVNKSGGGGLLVHHPVTPKKRVVTKTKTDHLSDELNLGYRILMELMSDYQKGSNAPFMEPIDMESDKSKDYLEVVKKPLWLKKIKADLLAGEYSSVTDLIGDLRTMLENAYRYYGPANSISKKGLRLEHMMEQKIALLPKEVRDLCSLEKTSGQPPEDITQKHRNKTAKISVNGDNFFSYVMYRVRGCRVQRDKELKKRKMEAMRQAKRDREQEVIDWEKMLMKEPHETHMRAMWELPQIGHFIFLTLKTLNIYEVPQYELERMLLMPRASRTLAMLLTSLLSSPQQRQKLSEKPYMPYKVWARKLAHKTLLWYRCYYRENRDAQKVFDQMGIEPQFWLVCGPTNPFDRQLFHEMTYHQRVWLLKSLCDFLLNNHKTVQEVIAEQTEADQREYYLGQDRDGNDYLHFPQFCGQDLRIYRRARVPSPEVEVQTEEVVEGSILPLEKIKEHRKMMRKYRQKYEEEAEWEGARGKKRKRKRGRGRGRAVDPEEEVGFNSRSRPVNLRQQPRARYNDDLDDLGLSSDDEPKPKPKRKWAVISDSEESDQEETTERPEEVGAAEEGEEDELAASNSPMPAQPESLTRAQQKNPRTRRGGKKKPTCELCGKTFQNIAALKGHRAVHTKEKQKLALNGDDIPVTNKRLTVGEESRETSEERTYNGADRAVSEEGSVTQNGDCAPELKRQLEKTSVKENDLKSESLVNGTDKDEGVENGNLKDDIAKTKDELETKVKVEIKREEEIKEELWDLDDERNNIKEENAILGLETQWDDAVKKEEGTEGTKFSESKTKERSPSPPKELTPIYDSSPYLPSLEMFELVVTSVEQLRVLIQKFGDLPEGMGTSTSTNTNAETDAAGEEEKSNPKKTKEDGKKRPSCEVKLHSALCNLLKELSPWESKLLGATKRLRTKMKHEWNDYEKRDVNYVDPAEEAWMSDPEPEPEPPLPQEQESSSSSSSSEESVDEDGNPKRKLRKRKAKRQAVTQMMETAAPQVETPSLAQEENADGYAVSSRGRVRKVKKMVNYDGLDFEKLAMQASEEAELERARKRKKREEEEKEKEEKEAVEEQNSTQPSGVRRYLLSQAGHVMGYIDNKGHVHSGSGTKLPCRPVQNLASQLVAANKKDSAATPTKPGMIGKRTFQTINVKPDVPKVVVAAIDDHGSPVYVRVLGEQALQLVKYMRPCIKGRVSQIKLQNHGQTYTVNTNAHMITSNIPGFPDGEATVKPASSVATATSTSNVTTAKPLTNLQSLATNNSPSVPRVAPISSVVSSVSTSNTIALAYRGVAKQARPTTVSAPVRPQAATIPKATVQQDPNRLTSVAHTRLVSASPSVVSSVVPPAVRTQTNLGSSPTKHGNLIAINQSGNRQPLPTIVAPARPQVTPVVNRIGMPTNVLQSEGSPVRQTNTQQQVVAVQSQAAVAVAPTQPLGQTVTATPVAVPGPGGQTQVQLKLESESLAQLMQRTGSKIVALPNGRGGYTLSLTPGAVQPGQKSQTQIAANTAAKVQVVSGANALLEDIPQPQDVQQQSQIVQQQTHVISQGVAQPAVVSQQTSLAQQIGVKQVVPASQVNVSGSGQVVSRVGMQQRVFSNLASSPQGARTTQVPVTAVIASHQQGGTIINTSQATGVLQKVTSTQSQLTGAQAGQHQIVLQQRVAPAGTQAAVSPQVNQGVVQQPAATYKQVVVNQPVQQVVQVAQGSVLQQQQQQQVVRLHPVSGSGSHRNTPTQKLVQIVQPGGGRQVVQMVQQVVASQGQANQGHQQLIYVQGNGQVIQQQPAKANIGTVQHTLQGTTTLQQGQVQQIVGQQNLGEQKLQQQILQQQTPGQSQQHIVQQKPVAQTQVVQQQTQQVMQQQLVVQQPQQQQPQQQQQTVVQQQQTIVQQQPVVQQQQQQPQQQQQVVQQQGRLVLVRTSQGEQMALQLPDGRVSLLTQEQLQAAINNGSIKVNQQN